eukprot:466060-Pyramimonas_sp.AAC.1
MSANEASRPTCGEWRWAAGLLVKLKSLMAMVAVRSGANGHRACSACAQSSMASWSLAWVPQLWAP